MLEALLCGTPVIGFPVGGVKESIKDGVNGYLSNSITVEGLHSTVNKFLETRSHFNGESISGNARKLYNEARQASQYLELYRNLVKLIGS
jgi:glycosyltransferase involved in cell wall biosynthesis